MLAYFVGCFLVQSYGALRTYSQRCSWTLTQRSCPSFQFSKAGNRIRELTMASVRCSPFSWKPSASWYLATRPTSMTGYMFSWPGCHMGLRNNTAKLGLGSDSFAQATQQVGGRPVGIGGAQDQQDAWRCQGELQLRRAACRDLQILSWPDSNPKQQGKACDAPVPPVPCHLGGERRRADQQG